MMLSLRGLPPDIKIAEIRNLIKQRCQVERVLLDQLEKDAGGTRRVTVAVTQESDGAAVHRVLSGMNLGVYSLYVEPYLPDQPSGQMRYGGHQSEELVGQGNMQRAQSQAMDPGQKFGYEISDTSSHPWMAEYSLEERSQSPEGYEEVRSHRSPPRRQGSALARRPGNRTLPYPNGGRKRLRSSSPPPPTRRYHPGQSTQPQMGMQGQYMPSFETSMPLTQTEVYNESMTMFSPPWAVPQPVQPLMGLSDLQMPFSVNPLHQFEQPFIEGPRFKRMQKQQSFQMDACPFPANGNGPSLRNKPPRPNRLFKAPVTKEYLPNKPLNSKNIPKATITEQTLPKKVPQPKMSKKQPRPKQSEDQPQHEVLMLTKAGKNIPLTSMHHYMYSEKTANIFHTMFAPVRSTAPPVKSFVTSIKQIIGSRLRELTDNEPVGKDLVKLYRAAYPPSSDETLMNDVVASLNMPRIPIPLAAEYGPPLANKTTGNFAEFDNLDDNVDDSANLPLSKYINPDLKMDFAVPEPSSTEKRIENLRIQTAFFITARLLKPNLRGKWDMPPEEALIRPYLKMLVHEELRKLPVEVYLTARDNTDLFRMYHERTSTERNLELIDTAIEKYNANNKIEYMGVFLNPVKTKKRIASWPDFYKAESVAESEAESKASQTKVNVNVWLTYAKMFISSEIFEAHKAEYDKHETELEIRSVMKAVRDKVGLRIKGLTPENMEKVVSTRTAIEVYRSYHPASTDLELLQGVIQERLEATPQEDVPPLGTRRLSVKRTAAAKLSNETAYRRRITDLEFKQLSQKQRAMLDQLRRIITWRLERIIESDAGAKLASLEELLAAYRKDFPWDKDEAFVRAVIAEREVFAARWQCSAQSAALQQTRSKITVEQQEENQEKRAKVGKLEKINVDQEITQPQESTITSQKRKQIRDGDVARWLESNVGPLAVEVMFGSTKPKSLRKVTPVRQKEQLEKLRKVIRQQLEKVLGSCQVVKHKQVRKLYRERHPATGDAALVAAVLGPNAAIARRTHIQNMARTALLNSEDSKPSGAGLGVSNLHKVEEAAGDSTMDIDMNDEDLEDY